MPPFDFAIEPDRSTGQPLLRFKIDLPDGSKDLDLPNMSRRLRVSSGVSVEPGEVSANGRRTAGGTWTNKAWDLRLFASPEGLKHGTVFDVSIGFKHQVLVSKEEYRLLLPLKRD
jgi:hypothetical protein